MKYQLLKDFLISGLSGSSFTKEHYQNYTIGKTRIKGAILRMAKRFEFLDDPLLLTVHSGKGIVGLRKDKEKWLQAISIYENECENTEANRLRSEIKLLQKQLHELENKQNNLKK